MLALQQGYSLLWLVVLSACDGLTNAPHGRGWSFCISGFMSALGVKLLVVSWIDYVEQDWYMSMQL